MFNGALSTPLIHTKRPIQIMRDQRLPKRTFDKLEDLCLFGSGVRTPADEYEPLRVGAFDVAVDQQDCAVDTAAPKDRRYMVPRAIGSEDLDLWR